MTQDDESTDQFNATSRAELIDRTMAALGFAPKQARATSGVEYAKVFAVGDSVGQVTAVFDRGMLGMDPPQLTSFIVTTQQPFDAAEDALTRLPPFALPDCRAALQLLGTTESRSTVISIVCARCGANTEEYIVRGPDLVCDICAIGGD